MAEQHKAENIILMDLRPDTVIADFFVLCNGNSDRQIKAIMNYIYEDVKKETGRFPHTTEGVAESGWVLMDYGDIVVHIFHQDQRDYYDLESLWRTSGQVILSIQ